MAPAAAAVFVIALIVQFPARVAVQWFAPSSVSVSGVSGSIWRGNLATANIAGVDITNVHWRLRLRDILRARLGADIEAELAGGFLNGTVAVASGERVWLHEVTAALSLGAFSHLSSIGPVKGFAQLTLNDATIDAGWINSIDGTISVSGLEYTAVAQQPLGDHQLVFDQQESLPINGTVTSLSGPFDVNGRVTLQAQRRYELALEIAAGAEADESLRRSLTFIGPANDAGAHSLQISGQL